jgi:signal transduction histidine kinase
MQRLGRAFGIRGQLYTTNTLAALAVSAAAVVGAWLLARRLDRGVAGIIRDVRGMEGQLEGAVTAVGIPELDEIGAAINRLAQTVKESQAGHMAVEARLRRAERLAALGRLVAGLAHEVRNPLASIRLKLHLARRSSTDPERLGVAFSVIEEEMERLDRLVDRLLTLTKSPEPHRLPTELDALLRSRADLWEGRTTEQGIVIELRPPASGAGSVLVDGDRVAQILDNLLANAVQALNGRGGRITLTLERPSRDEVLLEVADTGPGVPPDLVERLFEPFFTTRPGGTGLGLFLSAELARVLGGEIRYRAQPGGGACFEVRLPC